MMGNLMSECQEAVYRGFVPVPEDVDELGAGEGDGENPPGAKYYNSSR